MSRRIRDGAENTGWLIFFVTVLFVVGAIGGLIVSLLQTVIQLQTGLSGAFEVLIDQLFGATFEAALISGIGLAVGGIGILLIDRYRNETDLFELLGMTFFVSLAGAAVGIIFHLLSLSWSVNDIPSLALAIVVEIFTIGTLDATLVGFLGPLLSIILVMGVVLLATR